MPLLIDDNFTRPSTSPSGAHTTTGAGNGWIDNQGGVYSINANALKAIPQGYPPTAPYLTNRLIRPDAEKLIDQQAVLDITTPAAIDQNGTVLRYQSATGDCYMIKANYLTGTNAASLDLSKNIAGVNTDISIVYFTFTSGHSYEITATAIGINPTTVSATVTDTTTSTLVATISATTDSQSSLQVAGTVGIVVNSATQPTMTFSRMRVSCPTAATIAVNDSNLFLTGNWYTSGGAYAQSQNAGAYLKLGFTGTAIFAAVDMSPLSAGSVAAANWPLIVYSIDGGPYSAAIQLSAGLLTIPCATALAAASHTLELMILATSRTDDRWNGPANIVRISGFYVDPSAASIAPTLRPRRLVYYGDSIGEGDLIFGSGYNTLNADVRYAPPFCLSLARNAEVTNISFASQGWAFAASMSGNVPALQNAWNLFDANHSRLGGGRFTTMPDDIVICQGTNDASQGVADATVTAAVQATLTAIRAAAPSANLFVVIAPSGAKRSAITSGVSAYKSATADPACYLIDRGVPDQIGLGVTGAAATFASSDGVHPLALEVARLEAHTAMLMQAATTPFDTPGVTTLLARVPQTVNFDNHGWIKTAVQLLPAPPTGYGNAGAGSIAINHNTGGVDALRYVNAAGQGVGGAAVLIYQAIDWPGNSANIQATSTTGPDGRWLSSAYVNSGTYVAVFTKTGADGPDLSPPFTV